MILLMQCGSIKTNCPHYPIPKQEVVKALRPLQDQNREVWAWFNQLLDLCQQLGDCPVDE